MAKMKKIVAIVLALTLVFFVTGCQSAEPEEKKSSSEKDEMSEPTDPESTGPYYVLVVGNDSREGTIEINKEEYADGAGRSDAIMLVRVDPENYDISVITVPRDTKCTVDGSVVKLNDVYLHLGIDALEGEVESLTGVKIKYHLDMGFVEFENFINELGGVNADVPIYLELQDIVGGEMISLSSGAQDLNGAQALVLARVRKAYAEEGEACRQIQNRQLVQVGIQKVLNDPVQAAAYAQALIGNIETNWDTADLLEVISDFASNASEVSIASGTGPYTGGKDPDTGTWLAYRDEETWAKVIQAAENGEDMTSVVSLPGVYGK